MRVFKAAVAMATMVAAAGVTLNVTATAADASVSATATTTDPTLIGTTSDQAAGSCWEIKQLNSAATDGDYWLLTPKMSAPQQFYCDMTTDGGGWELIGKGRDNWDKNVTGQGTTADLLTPDLATMSGATSQYSTTTIDQLLNNGRPDALTDGVRLRRATNATGTAWQEGRVKFSNLNHFTWALGALNPVASWTLGASSGTGGTSQSFGTGTGLTRVSYQPNANNGWTSGFAFGSQVVGTSASTSFLYTPAGFSGAYPYTQVYIRPRVTSADPGFTAIPDSGTGSYAQPSVADSDAMTTPWGVSGLAGSTADEGDVEVQAFTQSGNTMYVGGNFKYVQQDAAGTGQVQQSFLAAFDVNTGQWLSSFRPVLNEQVKTLATLPNGDVVAGGDFSQANGAAATAIVALNPTTGATDSSWKVNIVNLKTAGVLKVKSLDVWGNYLYIGGSFTHMTGGTVKTNVYTLNLGRVSVTDGTVSKDWNGNLNGTVNGLSGSTVNGQSDRMYAVGFFTLSGAIATKNAAAFSVASNAPLATPAWNPVWSSTKSYQWAVDNAGGKVWTGGSEHSLFQWDPQTFNRVWGDIMFDKGDVQSITDSNGVVYAGCHCNYYDYQNSYTWPSLSPGWTRADGMNWFGAWNANTGLRMPQFAPHLTSRLGSGVWAIQGDSNGVVWAGGDLTNASTAKKAGAWAGGFARFAPNDSTAPGTPTNLQVLSQTQTTVTLGWGGVTDPSGVSYQVLRDDRTIATTTSTSITVPLSPSGRFFVRAADGAGNYSASTSVLAVGSGQIPPTAAFTWSADHSTASLDGSSSTTSVGTISDYLWDFGDGTGAHGQQTTHAYAAAGTYTVSLTVTGSNGATATATLAVTVNSAPTNASPTDVYGKQVYTDGPWAYYRLGEGSGATVAKDAGPDARDGAYTSGNTISFGQPSAVKNTTDTSETFNGSSGFISSPKMTTPPATFSTAIWFKTTSTRGGRLIGFSGSNTGLSSTYDRHIYMTNSGQLIFGAYNGGEFEAISPGSYNNGQWHMAVATMSPTDGMRLYVDGAQVATNSNGTAENSTGYWRVGGDNVWENATSQYLNGSLDEAAIFNKVLTPSQVGTEYTDGSTVIGPPVNTPPTASFTATNTFMTANVDAQGSSDTDGTIASYSWNWGDGTNAGSGQVTSHAYSQPGTYTITLTVKDNGGATASTTRTVTVTPAPVTSTVIPAGSTWAWKFDALAPAGTWNTPGFDSSAWASAAGLLGYGDASVVSNIDSYSGDTTTRPKAAYFVRKFQVNDASKVTQLVINTVANDGIVVYVNGVEVNRTNMPAGTITNQTFASTAVRTAKAQQVVINVPTSLLVNGTNVVAAETHLNFRGSPDLTFDLNANITTQG